MKWRRSRRPRIAATTRARDIAACEAAGITAFVPKPLGRGAAASKGLFAKEAFIYDVQADTCRCPNSETLFPRTHWVRDGHRVVVYYHEAACKRCPLRAQWTSAKRRRQVVRWEGEAVLDAMAARLAANPQMTRTRRNTVEHPFGTIKHAMNQGHCRLLGGLKPPPSGGSFSLGEARGAW